jgi:hypothetical protein
MLQTGQVLFRRLSVDFALVLPFKDSKRGGSTPLFYIHRDQTAGYASPV